MFILRTEDGQTLKWKASGIPDLKVGTKVVLTGGAVKDHEECNGVDQTAITRVK